MGITDNLRIQHKSILEKATRIIELLKVDELSNDPMKVHQLLADLAGDISFHLQREDEMLYPALMRHPDEEVSVLAKQYLDEMEVTLGVFEKYLDKWKEAESISKAPNEFVTDTKNIFSALSKRIDNEDNKLYPLIER